MQFQSIVPPPALSSIVRSFWTLEGAPAEQTDARQFRTMADGCPGLIYQCHTHGSFSQADKLLPEAFLFGQTTRHAELSIAGQFNTIGIFFYPDALRAIFGLDAVEFTDKCLDLSLLTSGQSSVSEKLGNAKTFTEKAGMLASFIMIQLQQNKLKQDVAMTYALKQIIESNGQVSLKELQDYLHLSERSFQRNFKQHTGMSPKLFSRVCRFQASLKQLQADGFNKLSDIAYANEYADQSHFIRSFKEFAGFSPYQYQKQTSAVVENLTAII